MSSLQPTPPAPSWTGPILIGALLAALLLAATLLLGLGASCCCSPVFAPAGIVPAWMALRQDPRLTPGQGFAVSFIGSGLGAVVAAASRIAQLLSQGEAALRESLRTVVTEASREMPADQRLSSEQLDQVVDLLASVAPFVPIVGAVVFTVLAALCGLLTVLVARPRQPR